MTTNFTTMEHLTNRTVVYRHQRLRRVWNSIRFLLHLPLFAVFCFVLFGLASCDRGGSQPNFDVDVRTPVQVQAVRIGDIENVVVSSGKLQPRESATVTAQILGRLYYERDENGERFYEGHHVKRGDVLARISGEEAELNLNLPAKRQEFEIAEREYNRQVALYEKGIITESVFERTRQTFTNAETAYRRALLDEQNTVVFAPMDGVILKLARDQENILLADESLIGSGQLIAQIADLRSLEANIGLVSTERKKIEIGDPVRIRPSTAYEDETYEGILERILPLVDEQSSTYPIVVVVPNEELELQPRSYVEVEIIIEQRLQVPYVSLDSVKKNHNNHDVVYVVEGQRVQERRVRLGLQDDDNVEILEGVEPGERVVFGGIEHLYPNQMVNVVREL
ncbi:MAG: efflux RND transporter periplasmic adaptor subunit [Gammaproteobacteria bacterium]|nr:efflux RND transporter periplasmic adaptor subunit [Gammaproteobacteria bacterium]